MSGQSIFLLVAIFSLLVLSALFSVCETALIGASSSKFYSLKKKKRKQFDNLTQLLKKREQTLSIILIGNNICNICASIVTTVLLLGWFGQGAAVAWSTFAMTILIIIFAEVLPKTYAIRHANSVVKNLYGFLWVTKKILMPLSTITQLFVSALKFLLPKPKEGPTVHEELRAMIAWHHEEGAFFKKDKDMLGGILDLHELTVEDVMVHRKNVYALDIHMPKNELIEKILHAEHTRIPLYRGNMEEIVGVIYVRDLFSKLFDVGYQMQSVDIASIMRAPWFIPEYTKVQDQLNAFLREKNHCALIVDEYGALMGLVTLEDILEEIVGDIVDEYDRKNNAGIWRQKDGSYVISGEAHIRDVNRHLELELPDEEATTLAGLVINASHSIPDVGQVFTFYGFRFQILRKARNQIQAIRMWAVTEGAESG